MLEHYDVIKVTEPDDDPQWIAQAHCVCGTTMQSDKWGNVKMAIEEAQDALRMHLQAVNGRAHAHDAGVRCRCEECTNHSRELSKVICQPRREVSL